MIALKGNLQDITKQSLLHSLQLLQNHIDDDTLSRGMQKQCVQCINALVEKCDKHLADAIVEKVSGLCTSIRDSIMSSLKQDQKVLYCLFFFVLFLFQKLFPIIDKLDQTKSSSPHCIGLVQLNNKKIFKFCVKTVCFNFT